MLRFLSDFQLFFSNQINAISHPNLFMKLFIGSSFYINGTLFNLALAKKKWEKLIKILFSFHVISENQMHGWVKLRNAKKIEECEVNEMQTLVIVIAEQRQILN